MPQIISHPRNALSPKRRRRRRWRRRCARAGLSLVGVVLAAYLAFEGGVAWWPYPAELDRPPSAATLLTDRAGVPLAMFVGADDQWRLPLAFQEISPHLLNAIVAVEDERFYWHRGVDWRSIAGAAREDLLAGRIRRGGSTLTMQLHRLRDPRPRTFANKLEQAVRARQLERRHDKRAVLVEYLNRAPFGGNLVGAGAASWRYFGKPCARLSLGEAALLAGLPQNPARLRPDRHPEAAAARRGHVLDRMQALGMITPAQAAEARVEPVNATWRPLPQDRPAGIAPADGALPTLLSLAAGHAPGLTATTLDAAIQRQTFLAADEQLRSLSPSGITAAAIVVLDTETAECLAAVSVYRPSDPSVPGTALGTDATAPQFIDLTRRPRSTGSVLKPLIYAAAFDAGVCSPGTVLVDAPASWPGYAPNNYDRAFHGALTAADALARSRNIPAMMALSRVGIERAVGVMDAAGLRSLARSKRPYGLSLAVGGAEASPMEVAEAYAMLARGGECRPVRLVQAGSGSIVATAPDGVRVRPPRCLRPEACWQVMACLSEPARTRGICPEAVRGHVAWKTGTSSGHHDAWCAATTARRTVVVWLGNPDGRAAAALVGQEAAAPLALRLIAALDPTSGPWPQAPDDRQTVGIAAAATGRLVLVSPAAGEEFVMSSDVPAERQRILLRAARTATDSAGAGTGSPADPRPLWWFVDGELVATAPEFTRTWWSPRPGSHEIRVTDADGHWAAGMIHVRTTPGR
jgi:penicillin-binding protein 1C